MGFRSWTTVTLICLATFFLGSLAQRCGREAGGAVCSGGLCCSEYGWCGDTEQHCGKNCQSQCSPPGTPVTPTPPGAGGDLASIVTPSLFDEMLKHRKDFRCPEGGQLYTYDAFVAAASAYPAFARTGDVDTRKREVAAFFGQTSHETTGGSGWPSAPDGPYAWGYCFVRERGGDTKDYCNASSTWPCAPGQKYYGRGPIQITHNYNYGPAGRAIGVDLLGNPELVATDPVVSFKTALWFWMTPQSPKPSCHDVITGGWTPSAADQAAGRVPGYGVITNIINGGLECGHGSDNRVEDRIGFYRRYCGILGVGTGANLDCYSQTPYGM